MTNELHSPIRTSSPGFADVSAKLTGRPPACRVAPHSSSKRLVPARSWGGMALGGRISSSAQR
ncbi:hypothetical protein OIE62_35400 [Streptomyces scopuliridis]|uniref:Uncharacterized protein n=1 Tax=Streptomyces scopuliridis TaxID=452529 RepID=A0ACD4ZDT7_9ACTN|nr:hypothetical protein [Streptomyces scopuliridis]WSB96509.1 hypothetical protein OG835_05530 [Streptomyces scopuliridis]WSC09787.1 hypothetical protein OIE62_35400 [Streptomyces scopuliridis]